MRKLEPENIAPESERPFEIRDRNTRVIGSDDAKWRRAHAPDYFNLETRKPRSRN